MIESGAAGVRVAGAAEVGQYLGRASRPFVLINERELSVLRRGLTKDGWKRALYLEQAGADHGLHVGAGLLSVAKRWLDRKIAIPECGGHFHCFFCDCGSRLISPTDFAEGSEYGCLECGRAYSGEAFDGAVRWMHHNHLSAAALALSLVHCIERDRGYAERAAEILLAYADAYPGPRTGVLAGGMMMQSLCEAMWVIPLAQSYDLIYHSRSLTEADRAKIEERLFRPIAQGLISAEPDANWAAWHLSAVGVIGLALKDARLVCYALESFGSRMREHLGLDGLWSESVHSYHLTALSAFVHLAEGCSRAGIDLYRWEIDDSRSLKSMFVALLHFIYPSFRIPAINDGWYDSFLPLDLYEVALRRWDEPVFAWALKQGYRLGESPVTDDQRQRAAAFSRRGFYAFLFGRDLPGRSGSPAFLSRVFPSTGVCTLRNERMMATLDYGPCLPHGHLDKLSFTLHADGALVAPDFGTPGHGSRITEFYRSTAAHNTVLVDGRSQEPASDFGLVRHHVGDSMQRAEAEASDCYPGVRHRRGLLLLDEVLIVSDEIESEEEHEYTWLMRCLGEPAAELSCEGGDVDWAGCPEMRLRRLSDQSRLCRTDWHCAGTDLALGLWPMGDSCDQAVGECPGETASRPVPVFACRSRGRVARFLAALVPTPRGEMVDIARVGSTIEIRRGDRAWVICVSGADRVCSSTLATDGELAVLTMRDGVVEAVGLLRGTYVSWQGHVMIEASAAAECIEVCLNERNPALSYSGGSAAVLKLRTQARTIKVNGFRAAAARSDGHAVVRVVPQMLTMES